MSLLSLFVAGCGGGWTTIRQGTYRGMPYEVQEREQSGLFASTNSLDWRIRLGKMKPVPVNATTTDWGPPYSTAIYGPDAYCFITATDTAYSHVPFMPGTTGIAHTMLYISPSLLNKEQFEQFRSFMKAEWPVVSKTFSGNSLRDFPDIIGLVHGAQDKYTKTFRGSHDGRNMLLRIANDGRISLSEDKGLQSETYSGLAPMVQLPGNGLLLDTTRANGGLSFEELRGFHDAYNTPVQAHFTVRLSNWAAGMEGTAEISTGLSHKWQAVHPEADGPVPEPGGEGSYLWLKQGGIVEEKRNNERRPGDWSYDDLTRTVTIRNDSTRIIYHLKSLTATELVLEPTGPVKDTAAQMFRRLD